MVRAKFILNNVSRWAYKNPAGDIVISNEKFDFSAVSANGDPNHENYKYWQSSPSGSFSITIANPDAAAYFELGREYYFDITKAD